MLENEGRRNKLIKPFSNYEVMVLVRRLGGNSFLSLVKDQLFLKTGLEIYLSNGSGLAPTTEKAEMIKSWWTGTSTKEQEEED